MKSKFLILGLLLSLFILPARADEGQKREMRTVWVATVSNIDWPKTKGTSSTVIATQKKQLTDMLDGFVKTNMNSICLQVRPMADALYKSSYEPWSSYVSGTRGKDPGWDPLAFAVEECHKRGIEINAWVNPYRFSNSSGTDCTTAIDEEIKNSGMLLTVGKRMVFNPGLEASRQHLLKVCKEMIQNYDIDGIIFDDYFYPGGGTPEDTTAGDYNLWKNSGTTMTIADWRRANVNLMVKEMYDMVQETKPYVKFSIGPAGVSGTAKTSAAKHNIDPCPTGSDWQYAQIYSDPIAWLEEGTIDYISPQLYWKTTHSTNPFGPLTKWWSYAANHFGRHHYASHNIYFMESTNTEDDWAEICKQISYSREYNLDNAPGVNFYSAKYINGPTCTGFGDYVREKLFTTKALEPALTWKPKTNFDAPANLTNTDGTLSWTGVDKSLVRYSVYAIPAGMSLDEAQSQKFAGIKSDYLVNVTYTPSYTLPDSLKSGYWYAVCVVDGWNNEFDPACLGAPNGSSEQVTLVSPVNGAAATSWNQEFKWSAATDASYRVQIATDYNFSDVLIDTAKVATNQAIINLSNLESETTYYWRVACQQTGKLTTWSDYTSFVTKKKGPAEVTTLVAPDNGASVDKDITFKFTKVDADTYTLQVAKDANFTDVVLETTKVTQAGDYYTYDYPISTGGKGTFYWRVLTDAVNCTQSVSEVRNFTVTNIDVGNYEPGYTVKRDIDVDNYADVNGMRLTNIWMRSVKSEYTNLTQENNGLLNRGFAVVGDTVYVVGRESASSSSPTYLALYNAETGEHFSDLKLGSEASVSYYPCNDVLADEKGNLVVTNLTLNVGSTPLKIFLVDKKTGAVTEKASLTYSGLAKPRIDYCGIIGDVAAGNFTVFATTSYGTTVVRWIIEDGEVTDRESITLNSFYPSTSTDIGIASRAIPVSQDIVYTNGGSDTYFTRYNLATGSIDDSFANNTAIQPEGIENNGGCVFTLGGKNYMLYANGDHKTSNGFNFRLAQNPTGTDFAGYSLMWTFPKQGLGSVYNSTWCADCATTPGKDGKSQMIYIYAPGNGLAAYKLSPTVLRGDVNRDGIVDVSDVSALISMVLGVKTVDSEVADVNGDGVVDVSDVSTLISLIL